MRLLQWLPLIPLFWGSLSCTPSSAPQDSVATPARSSATLPVEASLESLAELRHPVPPIQGPPSACLQQAHIPKAVVLITIDALRADAILPSEAQPPRTPNIQQFADSAIRFSHAYAHSSETQLALPALLSGRFPSSSIWETIPSKVSLLEQVKAAGFRTQVFTGNHWMSGERGYFQGVDHYRMINYVLPPPVQPGKISMSRVDGAALIQQALQQLKPSTQRRFTWIHLMDVHNPYRPPSPFLFREGATDGQDRYVNGPAPSSTSHSDLSTMRARYLESVAYTDALLAPLFRRLNEADLRSSALVIFTSDHGESLGEEGFLGHGTRLSPELLHVPLLMRIPCLPGPSIVHRPVAHIDILPTILSALNRPHPPDLHGIPLQGLVGNPRTEVDANRPPTDRALFAAVRSLHDQVEWRSTLRGNTLLQRRLDSGQETFSHLPFDQPPLSVAGFSDRVSYNEPISATLQQRLRQDIDTFDRETPARVAASPLTAEARGKLESLGYVGTENQTVKRKEQRAGGAP